VLRLVVLMMGLMIWRESLLGESRLVLLVWWRAWTWEEMAYGGFI
jgi:hypothetical protein